MTMQTLESNRAQGLEIATRTYEVMETMVQSLRGKRVDDVDPTLIRDLDRFQV
jgi:hypothetical protein